MGQQASRSKTNERQSGPRRTFNKHLSSVGGTKSGLFQLVTKNQKEKKVKTGQAVVVVVVMVVKRIDKCDPFRRTTT